MYELQQIFFTLTGAIEKGEGGGTEEVKGLKVARRDGLSRELRTLGPLNSPCTANKQCSCLQYCIPKGPRRA